MLVKLDDNLVVDSTTVMAVETIAKMGRYGAEDRSQLVLNIVGSIVYVQCSKSVSEIYDTLNTISN